MTRGGSTGHLGRFYVLLGTVGHVSRGVAVVLVGLLFGYAAVTHDPDKAGGLEIKVVCVGTHLWPPGCACTCCVYL